MTSRSTAVLLLFLAACGGGHAGGAAAPRSSVDLPPPTPAGEACGAEVEDSPPGNHDRYAFEDPNGTYGYKDGKGNVVIPPQYATGYEFGAGGIAAAVIAPTGDGVAPRLGFIDHDGRWLADAFVFDNGPDYFQEGLARIVDATGKVGFIARDGTIVIAPTFAGADSFCHGVAAVHDATSTWDIDRTGAAVGDKRPYTPEPDPCAD